MQVWLAHYLWKLKQNGLQLKFNSVTLSDYNNLEIIEKSFAPKARVTKNKTGNDGNIVLPKIIFLR